jgi:hypothetical protein
MGLPATLSTTSPSAVSRNHSPVMAAKPLRLAAFSVAPVRPGTGVPCGLATLAFHSPLPASSYGTRH